MCYRLFIKHIQTPYDQPWKGFFIASAMLAASWTQTAFYHQHYHIAMTTGMRMKIALMSTIYKKVGLFLEDRYTWNSSSDFFIAAHKT